MLIRWWIVVRSRDGVGVLYVIDACPVVKISEFSTTGVVVACPTKIHSDEIWRVIVVKLFGEEIRQNKN